ncbi:MAG: hypothetical protein WBZ40_01090 [Acidimicrobiia bacterium]
MSSWSLRRFPLAVVVALALAVAACTSASEGAPGDPAATTPPTTSPAASTTEDHPSASTSPSPPSLDLSKNPLVLFGPVPPMPPGADLPLPQGSADYFDLFSPGADWVDAAAHVDVFKLHAWEVRHFLSDDQLRQIFAWLADNDIPLMFETEPLQPPDPDVCNHTESFEGPYDLEMARRVEELGGTIAVVAIEEPYAFAHKLQGPGSCQYSVERIVDEVIDYIDEMRRIFPDVPVGSIEPVWQSPPTTADDMEIWLDTFAERAGEPFAFLHIDPDWNRPDWTDVALEIEAVADARGIPFGVLYNGGLETDGRSWLQSTMDHIAEFETLAGGTPQHIAFQSWVDQPDRLLPDDDLGAFTSIINRYFGTRTRLSAGLETDGESSEIVVSLVGDDGGELGGRPITIGLRPLSGAPQLHTVSGLVPTSATTAVIAIRVNAEDAVPGDANVTLSQVSYEEDADGVNRVQNPAFDLGLEGWGMYGDTLGDAAIRQDSSGGSQLELVADSSQELFIDSDPFPVQAGASYELRAVIGVPEQSIDTATVAVVFLADTEVARQTIRFQPVLDTRPPIATGTDDAVRIPTDDVPSGGYEVVVHYEGDLGFWPAAASLVLDVP